MDPAKFDGICKEINNKMSVTTYDLRFEITRRLRKNQNKDKELFLKIASSPTFLCNASSQ